VEISSGFIAIDTDDLVELTELVQEHGLKAKPEINVQFGAGGASSVEDLESEEAIDPASAVREAQRHLVAGAYKIMVESEGITERVRDWRTDVAFEIANEVGVENCVFEAADPEVFEWYIKNFGPEVNLFVDNSQIWNSNACGRASGARRVRGAGSLPTTGSSDSTILCPSPERELTHRRSVVRNS
jgi:phosphosulfolactate synthase (CoM biosynthesis protein A)